MVLRRINRYLKENFGVGFVRMNMKRGALNFAIKYFNGKKVIAVEIGTHKGINAKQILKNLNVKKIYLIDSYSNYMGYREYLEENFKKIYRIMKKNIKPFKSKAIIIKKSSEMAMDQIKEGQCDFIYIDGNHDYSFVKKDIENYYKKVKIRGILGGHDIDFTGVLRAVSEFAIKNNLKIYSKNKDWWIIKDKKKI